jgi:hypothetical protein
VPDYVVAFDIDDDAVGAAANVFSQRPNVTIVDANQAADWPPASQDCTLYVIEHGSGTNLGGYKNPKDLLATYPGLNAAYKRAARVVLVACSTANQAHLLLTGGFQAETFARALKAVNPAKVVWAAVGPVYADGGQLRVLTPTGVIGFASDNGWVKY